MRLKYCGGGESRIECKIWGLHMFIGSGDRRYCGKTARVTENVFDAGKEGAGVRWVAGLGGTSFGGKISCGERMAAGKKHLRAKIFCMGILGWELNNAWGIFEEGMKAN